MTDNELAAIRARNAARTPGNWCVQGLPSELWRRICSESEYIDVSIYLPRIVHSQGNAEFIAGASVDIPALIAEVERLRAMLLADQSPDTCPACFGSGEAVWLRYEAVCNKCGVPGVSSRCGIEGTGVWTQFWGGSDMRFGDWIQTYSGKQFYPLDPRPEEVDIADIAHALSMLCRFGGHCRRFYSVAEHCVLLSFAMPDDLCLWALLHDASEAYLVDVPRPIKSSLVGYGDMEHRIQSVIFAKYGLYGELPQAVKTADYAILMAERVNMAPSVQPWSNTVPPLPVALQYWTPEQAEAEFLGAFRCYTKGA